jgi:hypothetical protein
MRRIALLAALALAAAAAVASAEDRRDLSRVVLPDKQEEALRALKEWIEARGITVETHKDLLVLRRGGVTMNVAPVVNKGELDWLRVFAIYAPRDKYKGAKELEQLAVKLNRSQNFLKVFVSSEGNLVALGNLTFYDELTARVFDAFLDAFAQIVKQHVLTEEARKMLK